MAEIARLNRDLSVLKSFSSNCTISQTSVWLSIITVREVCYISYLFITMFLIIEFVRFLLIFLECICFELCRNLAADWHMRKIQCLKKYCHLFNMCHSCNRFSGWPIAHSRPKW